MTPKGKSANLSIAQAKRADARARAEFRLSPAQLRYLQTARNNAVRDWEAPSSATLVILIGRGFLRATDGHSAAGATNFYYLTEKAHDALALAERIAKATGGAQ